MDAPVAPTADPALAPDQRLHPWSWLFVLLQQLRQFALPLLALLVFGRGDRDALWPLIAVAVLTIGSLWQYFTYRYRITADSLVVRSGLFERSLRQIPFTRIHNVAVHQSLLHRIFGVAEVRLESAGGQKPEAQMRVLGLPDALALEQLFRQRGEAASGAGAGLAASAGTADGTPLLALPTGEVLRVGLVSNRGMVLVVAGIGALWQMFPERGAARAIDRLGRELFGYATHLQLGVLATVAAAIALLVLAIALLRLLSIAVALLQYHGFVLSEDARRLMVQRGLLARLRTSVARRRIQAWTLEEGMLHRLLARRRLRIDTAVSEKQGQPDARALKELAPIATPEACDALVRHLLPQAQWPPGHWTPLPVAAWWRMWLPTALVVGVLAGALAWRYGAIGLLPLLWLPVAALAAVQQARRAAYAADGQLVAVRGGWWARHWRFAEIGKLQALRLTRSPLDRRLGTASLWLDTAGAGAMSPPLRIAYLPHADAVALYSRLGQALAGQRLRW